jgi:hypothetical protein
MHLGIIFTIRAMAPSKILVHNVGSGLMSYIRLALRHFLSFLFFCRLARLKRFAVHETQTPIQAGRHLRR